MKDTGLYIYVHAIGFECKQLSTVREATTVEKDARDSAEFSIVCARARTV